MRAPFGWFFPAIAVLAAGIAVWAGPDLALAVPATVVAVVSAGFLIGEVVVRAWRPRLPPLGTSDVNDPVRAALRSGPLGREAIVAALDRVDRASQHPDLPTRTSEELRSVARLSAPEFRALVRERLDALERDA
ncbi:MAG TPA: hypothetical protein VMG81_03045 [Thermoplasmata archaeon]|nr:hypothetical protein [Thermoplasmata archaeon]